MSEETKLVHLSGIDGRYYHDIYFVSYDTGKLTPIISNHSNHTFESGLSDYRDNVWGLCSDLTEEEIKEFEVAGRIYSLSDAQNMIKQIHDDKTTKEYKMGSNIKTSQKNPTITDGIIGNRQKIVVDEETLLLPLTKIGLEDAKTIHSYYIIENGELKPILRLSGKLDDLLSGNSKYGNNVFALASTLPDELLTEHIDKIIAFKDAKSSLAKNEETQMHL